nr:DEAD/DEAH box helicase family protein [Pseudomonas aeruginosa]EIU2863521.1 DEAD/DEAH box helicase family protein [Pseudomonas aeruginosa]
MHFDLNSLAEHQHEGLHSTLQVYTSADRAQVHMACGTGKTRLGQAVAFATEADRVLVLLPSLSLISQTMAAWIALGDLPLDRVLCVCSDPSVAMSEDEDVGVVDLPVEVSTSTETIAAHVQRSAGGPLYVFCTYHSVPALAAGLPVGFRFDLGVFDEAHRTAGFVDAGFTFALHDHRTLKIAKRLFLTATPKHLPETARAGFDVYSMCNEGVVSRKPRNFRQPINMACLALGR